MWLITCVVQKNDITLMRALEIASIRSELLKWKNEYDWISSNDETFAKAWLYGYEVEQEPLYYAKIKGWEHIGYGHETMYWMFDKTNNSLYVSGTYKFKFHAYGEHNTKFTIDEWNKLGINDTNADFEEVE